MSGVKTQQKKNDENSYKISKDKKSSVNLNRNKKRMKKKIHRKINPQCLLLL